MKKTRKMDTLKRGHRAPSGLMPKWKRLTIVQATRRLERAWGKVQASAGQFHEPTCHQPDGTCGCGPRRVQLQRTKGWRMPANTVKVDRTTRWGNPFVMQATTDADVRRLMQFGIVDSYRAWLQHSVKGRRVAHDAEKELRGKNLACWCKPGTPCHAEVLLEIANGELPAKGAKGLAAKRHKKHKKDNCKGRR